MWERFWNSSPRRVENSPIHLQFLVIRWFFLYRWQYSLKTRCNSGRFCMLPYQTTSHSLSPPYTFYICVRCRLWLKANVMQKHIYKLNLSYFFNFRKMENTTFKTGYLLFSRSSSLPTLWFGNLFQITILLHDCPRRNGWYYSYESYTEEDNFLLSKYSF